MVEDQSTDDNRAATASGHRAEGRGPRRDFSAIHVIDRPANALILGLEAKLTGRGAQSRDKRSCGEHRVGLFGDRTGLRLILQRSLDSLTHKIREPDQRRSGSHRIDPLRFD